MRPPWHIPLDATPFVAQNTAHLGDGAYVHVAAGADVPVPVHLVFATTGEVEGAAAYPRNLILVDRDNRLLYELYRAHWNASISRWEAESGAVFDLQRNDRRPNGWTSADAAGLAIMPGLVRFDEMFGTEPIRHALRVTVRATNGKPPIDLAHSAAAESPAGVVAALWNHSFLQEPAPGQAPANWAALRGDELADLVAFLRSLRQSHP